MKTVAGARLLRLGVGLCLVGAAILSACGRVQPAALPATPPAEPSLLPRLPLDFIANSGQWDPPVQFALRNGLLAASFEKDAIRLSLGADQQAHLKLTFDGASPRAVLKGEAQGSGVYNFFIGDDPQQWRSGVPAYASLLYRGLYDGIDVRVREEAGRLEYDLLLAPGADLGLVAIRADGILGLALAPDGALVLQTGSGPLRQAPPHTWEVLPDGEKRLIDSHFRIIDPQHYGFEAPGHDRELALVVDPGLEWATFLGGSGDDTVMGLEMASDGTGDLVLAGQTWSPDFPRTGGNLAPTGLTPYVARLNAAGTALVYATFFGGTFNHSVMGLALDSSNQPVVVGDTNSLDFPTTPGAYDRTPGDGFHGDYDAYVIKFNATGGGPVFGTYLAGSPGAGSEQAWRVGHDPSGSVIVSGYATSTDFPLTPGAYPGQRGIFVSRLDPTGSQLTYSAYFGLGSVFDMVVDGNGFVNLTGQTASTTFPTTPGAFDTTLGNTNDAFVARLKLDGAGAADLKYSTFLGGAQWTEAGTGLALDPANPDQVTVAGWTRSGDFPTTPGAFQRTNPVPIDGSVAFVTRFRFPAAGGGSLLWSTLYGAPGNQHANDVVVDSTGAVIIVGGTAANNPLTTERAYDRIPNSAVGVGVGDAHVTRLSGDGTQLLYSTLLGGFAGESGQNIVYAGGLSVIVAGLTNSPDFPVTAGAFDTVYAADGKQSGGATLGTWANDVYLARLTLQAPAGGDTTPPPAPDLRWPAQGATFVAHALAVPFDWTDVSDPSGIQAYHVQISPNPGFVNDIDAELRGWFEPWMPGSLTAKDFSISETGPFFWRVQALDGAGNMGPWSAVRSITVQNPPAPTPTPSSGQQLASITPAELTVNGGSSGQLTVNLASPAPAGGAVVSLASVYPQRVSVPSSVTVPAGSTSAAFTVVAASAQVNQGSVGVVAEYGGVQDASWIHVGSNDPVLELKTFTLSATTVTGGGSVQGTVAFLTGWTAGPGGAVVALGSANPAVASVPASVTIPEGASSASFTITTQPVASATNVTLLAARSHTEQIVLEVLPPGSLSAVSLNPTTVTGGQSSQGTVTLSSAAPAGGVVVALSSLDTTVAQVPPSITVPQGATSATFAVTTSPVSGSSGTWSEIHAMAGGLDRYAILNVNPGSAGTVVPSPTRTRTPTRTTVPPTATRTSTASRTPTRTPTLAGPTATATRTPTLAGPTQTTLPTATWTPTLGGPAPSATATPQTNNTGLRGPTANTDDNGGDRDGYEVSPGNAANDDALNAVDNNSGDDSSTSCTGSGKDKHRFYNYGFSIPSGAAITGIQVRLDARADSTSGSPKICVQLSWDGGSTWTAAKSTTTLGTSMTTFTLGSATDTWGRSWSVNNFSNANFRVRVIDVASSTSRDFSLDWVAIQVYYR